MATADVGCTLCSCLPPAGCSFIGFNIALAIAAPVMVKAEYGLAEYGNAGYDTADTAIADAHQSAGLSPYLPPQVPGPLVCSHVRELLSGPVPSLKLSESGRGMSGLPRQIGAFAKARTEARAAFSGAGRGDVLGTARADQDVSVLLKVAHAQGSRAGLDRPQLAAEGPSWAEFAEVAKHVWPPHEMPTGAHKQRCVSRHLHHSAGVDSESLRTCCAEIDELLISSMVHPVSSTMIMRGQACLRQTVCSTGQVVCCILTSTGGCMPLPRP